MYEGQENQDSDSDDDVIEDPQKYKLKMGMKGFNLLMKAYVMKTMKD